MSNVYYSQKRKAITVSDEAEANTIHLNNDEAENILSCVTYAHNVNAAIGAALTEQSQNNSQRFFFVKVCEVLLNYICFISYFSYIKHLDS